MGKIYDQTSRINEKLRESWDLDASTSVIAKGSLSILFDIEELLGTKLEGLVRHHADKLEDLNGEIKNGADKIVGLKNEIKSSSESSDKLGQKIFYLNVILVVCTGLIVLSSVADIYFNYFSRK